MGRLTSKPRAFRRLRTVVLGWAPRVVARVPAPIHAKLLCAFLAIAALLVALSAVALDVLGAANQRAEQLGDQQLKVAAYRQLQTEMTRQLYDSASAFSATDVAALDRIRRQIRQSGYNFERLEFVTRDEVAILDNITVEYTRYVAAMLAVVDLVQSGDLEEARELHQVTVVPLAEALERMTNELVNRTEAATVATIDANDEEYLRSRTFILSLAAGSVVLSLVLGYAIAFSVITPVDRMGRHLDVVAAGDFTSRVNVSNRDELGVLAATLNEMTEELGRLYGELEAASRHKSEFLANMSHELRTPLNAVIGFSEVLAEHMFGDLNEKQDEYVGDILSSGRHLLSLINDILDLSKVEAGRMELEPCEFSLEQALQNGVTMIRERAARRGLTVTLAVDPAVGTIRADERKLKQVVFNLLSNAVKFTPNGGSVHVEAWRQGAELRVAVRDTGVGIPAADQSRIFEEFHQVHRTDAADREGTGLGLPLARRLLDLQGGRIWVESEPGLGSTFTFALPAPAPDPASGLGMPDELEPESRRSTIAPAVARREEAHGG